MTYNTEIYNPAKVYAENKAKGFWKEREAIIASAKGTALESTASHLVIMECIALINSELVEALTARIKGDTCSREALKEVMALEGDAFIAAFKGRVKDTEQDELADAVIRALDLLGGFNKKLEIENFLIDRENHSEDCLLAAMQVLNDATEALRKPEGNVWLHINKFIAFCIEYWGFFLEDQMLAKRKFNQTRAYLHGKTF